MFDDGSCRRVPYLILCPAKHEIRRRGVTEGFRQHNQVSHFHGIESAPGSPKVAPHADHLPCEKQIRTYRTAPQSTPYATANLQVRAKEVRRRLLRLRRDRPPVHLAQSQITVREV
jgi:hypothetical protein